MQHVIYAVVCCIALCACSKENTLSDTSAANNYTAPIKPVSKISIFLNGEPVTVTAIDYNRSSSTFNFTAQNALKKIDARCFWFIEYGKYSFQYSDSVNYSFRQDSLSEWTTIRANNYGNVFFDCCTAPLTDNIISGSYDAVFQFESEKAKIKGNFLLVFK